MPKSSYPKNSRNWNFKPKNPLLIPVTWNPEYPHPPVGVWNYMLATCRACSTKNRTGFRQILSLVRQNRASEIKALLAGCFFVWTKWKINRIKSQQWRTVENSLPLWLSDLDQLTKIKQWVSATKEVVHRWPRVPGGTVQYRAPRNSWWTCAPGSPNPDPISDQNKMSISTPVFRPGARFSKVPIINGPGELSPFILKIEVSIVLHLIW